jgi:hypothetical protein
MVKTVVKAVENVVEETIVITWPDIVLPAVTQDIKDKTVNQSLIVCYFIIFLYMYLSFNIIIKTVPLTMQ